MLLLLAVLAAASEPSPFTAEQEALASRAWEAMVRGDRETAREQAAQLVQGAPNNPRAWRAKGLIDTQLNALDDAETALTKSLDLGIDHERSVDVYTALGYVQLRKGR